MLETLLFSVLFFYQTLSLTVTIKSACHVEELAYAHKAQVFGQILQAKKYFYVC